jgi:hypothetical protein
LVAASALAVAENEARDEDDIPMPDKHAAKGNGGAWPGIATFVFMLPAAVMSTLGFRRAPWTWESCREVPVGGIGGTDAELGMAEDIMDAEYRPFMAADADADAADGKDIGTELSPVFAILDGGAASPPNAAVASTAGDPWALVSAPP